MLNEFQDLLNKIDKNIQDKKIYDDPLLLKNTTELLSSANILLSKEKNIHNDYFQNEFLEKCYNDIKIRKNQLSDITNQYKEELINKKKKRRLDFDEDDYLNDDNYKIFNKDINDLNTNKPYELGFITQLNESLLNGTVKNLNNIQNNIEITSRNLKTQGDKLNNISNKSNHNEENVKAMIRGTFLDGHASGIINAANNNNINPYYIIARLLQEQGISQALGLSEFSEE